jgi:hypothetical protein
MSAWLASLGVSISAPEPFLHRTGGISNPIAQKALTAESKQRSQEGERAVVQTTSPESAPPFSPSHFDQTGKSEAHADAQNDLTGELMSEGKGREGAMADATRAESTSLSSPAWDSREPEWFQVDVSARTLCIDGKLYRSRTSVCFKSSNISGRITPPLSRKRISGRTCQAVKTFGSTRF